MFVHLSFVKLNDLTRRDIIMHEFWIFPRMLPRVEFSNSFPYMEKTVYGGHKVKLTSFTNMYILTEYSIKTKTKRFAQLSPVQSNKLQTNS